MKLKSLVSAAVITSQIFISVDAFAAGPRSKKSFNSKKIERVSEAQLKSRLELSCSKSSECQMNEIDQVMDSLRHNAITKSASKGFNVALKGIKKTPHYIGHFINGVATAGLVVGAVTVYSGAQVLVFTGDKIKDLYDVLKVKKILKGGKKVVTFTVSGTYKGIKKSVQFTSKIVKRSGVLLLKPVKFVVGTTFKALKNISRGTLKVVKVTLGAPIILAILGVDYALHFTAGAIHTGLSLTLNITRVAVNGVWSVAKFGLNGVGFVLSLPVRALNRIL